MSRATEAAQVIGEIVVFTLTLIVSIILGIYLPTKWLWGALFPIWLVTVVALVSWAVHSNLLPESTSTNAEETERVDEEKR